ncbi:uncharacterized protein DNG_04182 [Cephalotrichum gorgonifer]|uniref:Uncharacterized protein n=1 Tax=Cephalotrichum gorgonifer TaxID=2041049 RepID=A0AAE8MY83_9PEZI|nr:uncharacterized protein DNG_04182 [Cephalotrichum gorgonifer]
MSHHGALRVAPITPHQPSQKAPLNSTRPGPSKKLYTSRSRFFWNLLAAIALEMYCMMLPAMYKVIICILTERRRSWYIVVSSITMVGTMRVRIPCESQYVCVAIGTMWNSNKRSDDSIVLRAGSMSSTAPWGRCRATEWDEAEAIWVWARFIAVDA